MIKIFFTICSLFLVTQAANGQDFGYLGKKNLISVSATSSFRFLTLLGDLTFANENVGYNSVKYNESNAIKEGRRIARYDVRVSYARQLSSRLALGTEFSYDKINLARSGSGELFYSAVAWSTPVVNAYGIFLTLTTNSKDKLTPIGYSSTFGLGTKIYNFNQNQNYRFDEGHEMKMPYPDYANGLMGVNVFWQPSFRIAVNRFMLIDVGLRLQTGVVFQNGRELKNGQMFYGKGQKYTDPSGPDYYTQFDAVPIWTKAELLEYLKFETITNLGSFRMGLCFML